MPQLNQCPRFGQEGGYSFAVFFSFIAAYYRLRYILRKVEAASALYVVDYDVDS